jgi:flagellar hook-length control protein FliK
MGSSKAADPAKAAASAAVFELARAAQAPEPATGTPILPAPATGALPTGETPATGPAIVALPGVAAVIAGAAGAAKPAGIDATDPTYPPDTTAARSRTSSGAHGASHRPAAPGVQAPVPEGQAAGPAPVSPGLPAEPGTAPATVHAGTPSADPAIQAAQGPTSQPVPAGQPAASGSEPVHRHPAAEQLPLARQVAGPVLALRAGGDGSHQLIVALHPAELGPVNVHVRIVGDLMTIALASTSESAHDALRDALPQLRSELQSAGLSSATLSLDLTSGDAGGRGAFANPRQDAGQLARAVPADPTPAAPRRSGDGRTNPNPSAGLDRWL